MPSRERRCFSGEESVPPGAEASSEALAKLLAEGPDWLWVVDPIDGTTNFVHGMPLSAISIGVAYKGEMQVAGSRLFTPPQMTRLELVCFIVHNQ